MVPTNMELVFARQALDEAREEPDIEKRIEKVMEAVARILRVLEAEQSAPKNKPLFRLGASS